MNAATSTSVNNARTASGINLIAGLWLIIAPFVLTYYGRQAAMWNDVILGVAIVCLAGIRLSAPLTSAWASWVNVILGVWLVIAPFVLTYNEAPAPLYNDIILGVIVAGLGVWSGVAAGSEGHHHPAT